MVNINRHELAATVPDEQALELFCRQWAVYQKLVDNNYLNHAEVYRILHRVLAHEIGKPFRLLDLACGDAGAMVRALNGTRITHYHGVDLARPGARARQAQSRRAQVRGRARAARFHRGDARSPGARRHRVDRSLPASSPDPGGADADARGPRGDRRARPVPDARAGYPRRRGPGRLPGPIRSDHAGLVDRSDAGGMAGAHDARAELRLPETVSSWLALGRDAGFAATDELFKAPSDLFRMFCYRA